MWYSGPADDTPLLRRLARGVPSRGAAPAGRCRREGRLRRHLRLRSPAAVVGARRVRPRVGVARRRRAGSTTILLGTGVTSTGARYHPAMIAQAWATLERLFPGRAFLGIGSGEALNEVPLGDDWPSPRRQDRAHGRGAVDHRPPVERRDDHRRAATTRQRPQAPHAPRAAPADLGVRLRAAGRQGGRSLGRRLVDAPRPRVHARGDRRVPRERAKAGKEGDGEIVFQACSRWAPDRRGRARVGAQVEGRPARGPLPR